MTCDTYKYLFDNNFDMCCISSHDGVFIDINNKFAQVLGYSKYDLIGHKYQELVHPDDLLDVANIDYKFKNDNNTNRLTFSIRCITKNGTFLLLNWNSLYDREEKILYSIINNKNEELVIAKVSHELKTPLNVINGYSQLLLVDNNLSKNNHLYINRILENCDLLLDLINNLLDVSRLDTKDAIENISVYDIIHEVIVENKKYIENNNLKLFFDAKYSENSIPINKNRFKQILNNILNNAIKYNKKAGDIHISCNVVEDKIKISIEDSGIGIKKEFISKLYQPFERLDIDSNKYSGTGLGLCIVKKFVNLYNGSIECESEENKYTKFTLSFQLSDQNIQIESMKPNMTIENNYKKILYIEDNINNASLISEIIYNRYQIRIDIANYGKDGIELIKKNKYHLILIDYLLIDINGDTVIETIKNQNLIDDTDVIIITSAYSDSNVNEFFINNNIKNFLPKPINIRELYNYCDKILL